MTWLFPRLAPHEPYAAFDGGPPDWALWSADLRPVILRCYLDPEGRSITGWKQSMRSRLTLIILKLFS